MHQGDFNPSYYHHHNNYPPNPNPIDHNQPPPSYASAPPFSATPTTYPQPPQQQNNTTDYSSYPHNYPPPISSQPPPLLPSEPHGIYSPVSSTHHQSPAPSYYPSYDSQPPLNNYPPMIPPSPYPNPNPNPYGFDYGSNYPDETGYGGSYGSSGRSDSYPKRGESERYDSGGSYKDDGVYAYEGGGKAEPYGARGTASKSSTWSGMFDDYGRAISFPSSQEKKNSTSLKVVKAVPKVDTQTDVKSGVQKFRVKLLAESGGQSTMDVLCMVGLDGIRMVDPNTSRTLRIYPLDTVTRCDKIDSSTFAFWSKTSVDVEPRRIRLQSNSYTNNTILDTVTAATVQFKEMGGRIRPSESFKAAPEVSSDKKKGLTDWINKLKPVNEEKDHWVPDEVVTKCTGCGSDFSAFNRRHHCRNCGDIFCDKCTQGRTPLNSDDNAPTVRVCDRCMAEVSRRLNKAKEVVSRPVALHSHEDLAKKLQEEMEKNLRISGSKSEGTGKQMREVACPTCTVHLQVQVPSSGSETIECGVCQHPFLVSAH